MRWFVIMAVTALFGVSGATAQPSALVVSGFTPTSGTVGTAVTVTGSGFSAANGLDFAGVPAPFSIADDAHIQTSVPFGATTGRIEVCMPGACARSTKSFKVKPRIDALNPPSGPIGSEVMIEGSALDGTSKVTFDGVAASFTVDSYEQVRATVPAGAGDGPVKLTTPAGTATSPDPFTITGPMVTLSPRQGHPKSKVTLSGRGFQPLEPLQALLDHNPFGSGNADDLGGFRFVLTTPADLAPGSHEIDVIGLVSSNVALALFGIVEPWTQFHFDSANTGYQPYETVLSTATVPNLVPAWSSPTGGPVTSSPAVSNGVVYVGSQGGSLYAFKSANGAVLWSALTGGPIKSSPAVVGANVYVGSEDGSVYAFKASNGALVWSFDTGNTVDASPTVANGVVFVNSTDGNLYALNATTGAKLWASWCACPSSAPAVANGYVYANAMADIYAFDATTGSLTWQHSISFIQASMGPSVAKGIVYIGTDTGSLCTFAATGLTFMWCKTTYPGLDHFYYAHDTPTVAKGVVSVGVDDGSVYAFNAAGGTPLWTRATGGAVRSSSAVANGVLYVGSEDGNLYALNAASGTVLWSAATSGPIDSSPAVSEGRVYVGSNDGKLYAFRRP